MSEADKLHDLTQASATFQKGILIIELLTNTLNLPGGCGWNEVNNKMRELQESYDELAEMVGVKAPQSETLRKTEPEPVGSPIGLKEEATADPVPTKEDGSNSLRVEKIAAKAKTK